MRQWLAEEQLVITDAEGMHLIDSDGNRYLDGVSSLWCNVHGHRVPEIDNAIRAQLERVAHTTMLGLASEPGIILADRLMRLVPPGLTKIFYSDAGATANEIAFKLAVQYWHNLGRGEKNEFVGFAAAYHGDTVGAMSVGRMPAFHQPYFPMLFKVHFAPSPNVYRGKTLAGCLWELERILDRHGKRIAAVCIEPVVQGAGGMIVQPAGFLAGVQKLCRQYDVLLIADEVAVGFGRTGRMFACEHENVTPELLCLAKGLTGGYLPMAATLASEEIWRAFLGTYAESKTFYHGHTYGGNPLGAAAALATLEVFEEERTLEQLSAKIARLGEHLARLGRLPQVGDVRQRGLIAAVELVRDVATKEPYPWEECRGLRVCDHARREGVWLRPLGNVIVIMPPLSVTLEQLDQIAGAVERGILLATR